MDSKPTILIADDDRDYVNVIHARLIHAGYCVVEAYEGIRVMEQVRRVHPDLILLDLGMPAGDGDSVLRRLQHHAETSDIPVIIVSGSMVPGTKERVLTEGAKAFFQKPCESQALLAEIERQLMDAADYPMSV